jgi:hypothetical protein
MGIRKYLRHVLFDEYMIDYRSLSSVGQGASLCLKNILLIFISLHAAGLVRDEVVPVLNYLRATP